MLLTLAKFVLISIFITALIAVVLIVSQSPDSNRAQGQGGLNFAGVMEQGIASMPMPQQVAMRDGWQMPVRAYTAQVADAPLLLLIHGSGWNGLQFSHLALSLSAAADILVPDLRGHGESPERRGDVDYISQMEDDLADLITARAKPNQKVIVLGHSSGGGLVVRFAGGKHGQLMDQAILLAPYLRHNAPTTRENSGGWANVLVRRVIGLTMLNAAKITVLNHLPIITFNMPEEALSGKYGHLATTQYSYRLNTGYAPRHDYLADIAALPAFTLIAGTADEAFYADKYENTMSAVNSKGTYRLVEGADHLGVVNHEQTIHLIKAVL